MLKFPFLDWIIRKQPMYEGKNYIAGEFKPHTPDFSSLNPCTEMEIGMFPITEGVEIDEAVDAARSAFYSWRKISRVKRAEYFDTLSQLLKRDTEKLVNAISLETGKNKNESLAEVNEALHMCQIVAASGRQHCGEFFASEITEKDAVVIRKPRGVVAVVAAWNFPLAIGSFWSSAPAIVEGNCVVHKPSEYTPMVAQIAAELYHEAGFPPGVYNLIHGMDLTGKGLVENNVDTILFTGSAEVGQLIRKHCATGYNKTVACETGSKSAVMVFEDANIDMAVDACFASAFKLSGQRCVSASRLLVHADIVHEFIHKFVERVDAIKTGDPFDDPAPYYGPLICRDATRRVEAYNKMAKQDGVLVLCDGAVLDRPGFYMTPFVYKTEWKDAPYLKHEVFGPHVAIIPFDNDDSAIDIYNDTEFGLALGVITEDFRRMRRIREECDAGMIYMNGGSIAAESSFPFGGVKKSGNGYKSAAGTYRAVTEEVVVTMNYGQNISFPQGMK